MNIFVLNRVCKLESAIQTLKLNLLRTTAERDLSKKEKAATSEKMRQAAEIYEMELQKVNREISHLRKENKRLTGERQKSVEDVKRLQGALDIASSNKVFNTWRLELTLCRFETFSYFFIFHYGGA